MHLTDKMLYLCTSTYNKIHALTNDIGQPNHNHRLISGSKVIGPHRNTSIRRYPKELQTRCANKALVTNKVCKFSPLTNNYTIIYNTGLSPLPWFPRIHQLRRLEYVKSMPGAYSFMDRWGCLYCLRPIASSCHPARWYY
jgi:hypothetical protein